MITMELEYYITFLTHWGLHITNISLALSLYASYHIDHSKYMDINYKALANVANAVAQTMNIIVTLCAWTLILPVLWTKENAWSTISDIIGQLNNIFIHSFPLISSTVNIFVLSDSIIYMTDFWAVFLFGFSYMA